MIKVEVVSFENVPQNTWMEMTADQLSQHTVLKSTDVTFRYSQPLCARFLIRLQHLSGAEPSLMLLVTLTLFLLDQVRMSAVKKFY